MGDINSKNNDYNGDNNSVSNSRRNDTLGSNILRKGRYADNPSLYVKTSRTDGIEDQDVNYSFLQDNDSIDEIASYSALEALRESGLDIDSYDTSYLYNFPSNDELINGVLTRKGEERMQVLSPFAATE